MFKDLPPEGVCLSYHTLQSCRGTLNMCHYVKRARLRSHSVTFWDRQDFGDSKLSGRLPGMGGGGVNRQKERLFRAAKILHMIL